MKPFSATQIKAFRACPRKWALIWLARVPKAPSAALEFGTDLHRSIAEYLTDRPRWAVPPESSLGQLTQDMARCVSFDGADLVEVEIDPEDGSRDRWVVGMPGDSGPSEWHVEIGREPFVVKPDVALRSGGVARIVDWKTTSATEARSPWVLSSRRLWPTGAPPGHHLLVDDEQARIYALGAFRRWDVDSVVLQWVYGSKRARGAHHPTWSVIETLHREETEAWVEENLASPARLMAAIRAAHAAGYVDVNLVPHDGGACEFVGKFCDGLAHCGLIPRGAVPLEDFRRRLPVI